MHDTANVFNVHLIITPDGPRLIVPGPLPPLTPEQALLLAAWLAGLSGASMEDVARVLERVRAD